MSWSGFEIEITEQGWIDPDDRDMPGDLCSHGDIRLEIGGQVIVPGQGQHWYTISTSALALLRTLEADHSPERPVADRLILCCGMLMMLTCPIGIDWSVTHLNDHVCLHEVVRYDTPIRLRPCGSADSRSFFLRPNIGRKLLPLR